MAKECGRTETWSILPRGRRGRRRPAVARPGPTRFPQRRVRHFESTSSIETGEFA